MGLPVSQARFSLCLSSGRTPGRPNGNPRPGAAPRAGSHARGSRRRNVPARVRPAPGRRARDTRTRLNLDERRSLATAIALSGGALLVSDDLTELSQESLRLVQALVPGNPRAARVIGWDMDRGPPTAGPPCHGAMG